MYPRQMSFSQRMSKRPELREGFALTGNRIQEVQNKIREKSRMNRIRDQFTVSKYTILLFDELCITGSGKTIKIDDKSYSTEMVFDLPNSIAIIGHGEYIGKDAGFE